MANVREIAEYGILPSKLSSLILATKSQERRELTQALTWNLILKDKKVSFLSKKQL
jgi:hypothetical protein